MVCFSGGCIRCNNLIVPSDFTYQRAKPFFEVDQCAVKCVEMAIHSLYRLVAMCIIFLAVSFSFFFLFNESPKRIALHSTSQTQSFQIGAHTKFSSPPIDRIQTTELVGETSEIGIDLTIPKDGSITDTKVEDNQLIEENSFPLSMDISNEKTSDLLGGKAGNYAENNDPKTIFDEEKLREQIVKEDPTWVSWQRMNQVRYLSLLTGQ